MLIFKSLDTFTRVFKLGLLVFKRNIAASRKLHYACIFHRQCNASVKLASLNIANNNALFHILYQKFICKDKKRKAITYLVSHELCIQLRMRSRYASFGIIIVLE